MVNYGFEHQGKVYGPDGPIETTDTAAHNKAVEAQELEWLNTGPEKVFLYVAKHQETQPQPYIYYTITTWLGTVVSSRCMVGPSVPVGGIAGPWAKKRSIDCIIFGRRYVGWYYESAGSYCRLRLSKRQPKP